MTARQPLLSTAPGQQPRKVPVLIVRYGPGSDGSGGDFMEGSTGIIRNFRR